MCVDPSKVPCPTLCTTSSECSTAKGEVCCNGLCSTSCAQNCTQSSDCRGQVCCKTRAARSSWLGVAAQPGFARSGCTSSTECTGQNQRCVGGACKAVCAEVFGCLEAACMSGCDPNKVCDALACPAARAVAQCIAAKCTICFGSGGGFGTSACLTCIDAATGPCAKERQACNFYGCQGNDPPPIEPSTPDPKTSDPCQAACAKFASCGSTYKDALCTSSIGSCPSTIWPTMQCLRQLVVQRLERPREAPELLAQVVSA